jgi:hypothetical protein
MVVYDLNFVWFTFDPGEADTILVIDPNTILALPLALEGLQLVAGRYSQLLQQAYGIELIELSPRHAPQTLRAGTPSLGGVPAVERVFGPGTLERADHANMIARNPC